MTYRHSFPIFVSLLAAFGFGAGITGCEDTAGDDDDAADDDDTGDDDSGDDDDSTGAGCCVVIEGLTETMELCESGVFSDSPALLIPVSSVQLVAALDGQVTDSWTLSINAQDMTEAGTYEMPFVDFHDDVSLYTNMGFDGSFTLDAMPAETEQGTGSFTTTVSNIGTEGPPELTISGDFCAVRAMVN